MYTILTNLVNCNLDLTTFVLAFTRFFTSAGQLALCMPTLPGNGQKKEVVSAVDE
jgi:hypothetical protein